MARPNRSLMNEKQLQAWLLRQLGAPQIPVELHPADLADIIEDAKDWFVANRGIHRKWSCPVSTGVVTYSVPEDVDTVIDVVLPGYRVDAAYPYYDMAGLGLNTLPLGDSLLGSNPFLPTSDVYATQQYLSTAQRTLSIEPDWMWDEVERTIILAPPPRATGTMIVEYISTSCTLDQMNYFEFELIKRYVTAKGKIKLGRVRSRWQSFPGVQSDRSMDGETLLAEGKEELETLKRDIAMANTPGFLLVG